MSDARETGFDVAVIGGGMAGMASALFAAQRGLSCVQVGNGGSLLFASGLLDLLGIHPVSPGRQWMSPFEALAALALDEPLHPLARIDAASIRAALASFIAALASAGLDYAPPGERNRRIVTSVGTTKISFGLPRSMLAGADALEAGLPCLLLDVRGLREFSAAQIAATLGVRWPGLRHARIEFPGCEATPELHAAHLARALETRETRGRAIAAVKPLLGDARAVGFPALLGLARAREVHAAFEAGLGVPVFEIPTMPTSVPGLRLLQALETAVSRRGVRRYQQASVRAVSFGSSARVATLVLEGMPSGEEMRARAVVLATGRFLGRGLSADRSGIRESIIGIPVWQPDSREIWHEREFFDPRGHAINRAGLMTDDAWRPLDAHGKPVWPMLYAVGSILAHQDWMRAKCGSGLAIATAWAATEQLALRLDAGAAE